MSITLESREDGWVVFYTLSTPISFQELSHLQQKDLAIRNAANHTVHELIDATRLTMIPEHPLRAWTFPSLNHPRAGFVVVVGGNAFVRMASQDIHQLAHLKVPVFVDRLEEGWAYLRKLIAQDKAANSYCTGVK
ncbi:MAG TPA: hypothetical protein VKQ72_07525 [Aggregatilineales bacterium]|nr:hypothetical protein [Aggregatilineales bacterium]